MASESVQSHITKKGAYWYTARFPMSCLMSSVSDLHFVAHENPDNKGHGNIPPTNHWTLFLTIGDNSIRTEVIPVDIGDRPAIVVIEEKGYPVTQRATHIASMQPTSTLTVEDVLAVIIANGRDRYIFADGEGCRFWLYTLANDLACGGVIAQSDANQARADLANYWPYPTGSAPINRPFSQGRFF